MKSSLPLAAVLGLAALTSPTFAQCVVLGSPGFTGCAPGGGIAPGLYCSSPPQIGAWLGLSVASLPPIRGQAGFLPGSVLLLGQCTPAPFPAPSTPPLCPAAAFGGCFGYVDLDAFPIGVPWVFGPGCLNGWCLLIPNDPSLVGLTICAQVLVSYALVSPPCIGITNGLSITILP